MGKPVLYGFSAVWCEPCKLQVFELEKLRRSMGGSVEINEIDVDMEHELVSKYRISVVPTVIIEKDESIVHVFEGVTHSSVLEDVLKRTL